MTLFILNIKGWEWGIKIALVPMSTGEKWPHKENHRQWYPLPGVGGWGNKCQVSFYQFILLFSSVLMFIFNWWMVSFLNSTTYITCPADPKKTLGIKLPFLIMIIKNLRKYFTFEVQVGRTFKCFHAFWSQPDRFINTGGAEWSFAGDGWMDIDGVVVVTQAFSLWWQPSGVGWQKCPQEIPGK